jgi:hypothetical protein
MKTIKLALVGLALSTAAVAAFAQHRHPGYYENSGDRDRNLGIGLIIGALGATAIYQSRQPVYEQPPVVVVPPPVVYYPAPPVYVEQPPVVYLQDGTRLTYSYRSGLWVDNRGRAYNLPR